MLATGASHTIAEKYHVSFEGMALMKHMTVLQAFGITFMYMFCYFVFLGVLLYVCNLMFGGFGDWQQWLWYIWEELSCHLLSNCIRARYTMWMVQVVIGDIPV